MATPVCIPGLQTAYIWTGLYENEVKIGYGTEVFNNQGMTMMGSFDKFGSRVGVWETYFHGQRQVAYISLYGVPPGGTIPQLLERIEHENGKNKRVFLLAGVTPLLGEAKDPEEAPLHPKETEETEEVPPSGDGVSGEKPTDESSLTWRQQRVQELLRERRASN